jgi:hypothetical protein
MPYGDLNGQQVLKMLEEGGRLAQPRKCSDIVYRVSDGRVRHDFLEFTTLPNFSIKMSVSFYSRSCAAAGNLRSTTDLLLETCSSNSLT